MARHIPLSEYFDIPHAALEADSDEIPVAATRTRPMVATDYTCRTSINPQDAEDWEYLSTLFTLRFAPDGVHRQLSPSGGLVVDLSHREDSALYRVPGEGGEAETGIPFGLFAQPATNPPLQRLVIISKQLPRPVEVVVNERDRAQRFVRVCDVLRSLKIAMTEHESALALHTPDGRARMRRGSKRRDEPMRRVDFLGEETVLRGLRKAVRNELYPDAPADREKTVFLVAEFVSYEQRASERARVENAF